MIINTNIQYQLLSLAAFFWQQVCPDGSSPDANAKCPPMTQGSQSSSSPPLSTEDNTNHNHNKGSNLSQLPPLSGDNNIKPSKQKHPKGSDITAPPTDQEGLQ
jgi:hypothetical protein